MTLRRGTRRFPLWAPWTAGIVGGAAIVGGQFFPIRNTVEESLTTRSIEALAEAGYGNLDVHFTGRDGVVSGLTPTDDKAVIADVVLGVTGVRVVDVLPIEDAVEPAVASSTTEPSDSTTPTAEPSAIATPTRPPVVDQETIAAQLTGLGPVPFATDDAGLAANQAVIEQIAATIATGSPTAVYEVRGYTDSVGESSDNQILSEQRATSVMQGLVNAGISPTQLVSVGFGETDPAVFPEMTEADLQANRRVVVVPVG